MSNEMKEVWFDEYCKKCEHFKKKENEDPCNDCLAEPCNLYSHQPIFYKEAE